MIGKEGRIVAVANSGIMIGPLNVTTLVCHNGI